MNVVRWILLLPAAVLAYFVVGYCAIYILQDTLGVSLVGVWFYVIQFIRGWIAGYASAVVCGSIAPDRKVWSVWALMGFCASVGVALLFVLGIGWTLGLSVLGSLGGMWYAIDSVETMD